ncbi:MAG: threonylcarbamoyl-AMP synthase [Clostridia bacterium]|nr:MAG: threonylcarbamoyl-AMP synthase [Clostridia bacterium]
MRGVCVRVTPARPERFLIHRAAAILRRGGLVAFPTETVYGLGAVAFAAGAVKRIFAVKGRPADNPLIVHVGYRWQVKDVARVTPQARKLMRLFWPGPLTLVLPARPGLPAEVTAGLSTVGVRQPDHPVALALLRTLGQPVAAPSANRSGRPSPTTGRHVREDLGGQVDMILEAGPCRVGLESTVLDLTAEVPVILRPGGISREALERILGQVALDPALAGEAVPKSPGQKYRHYAPRAEVQLVPGEPPGLASLMVSRATELAAGGRRVGLLVSEETAACFGEQVREKYHLQVLGSRRQLEVVAGRLYEALLSCDRRGMEVILAETFPDRGLGLAIMNRLRKAAGAGRENTFPPATGSAARL